MFKHLLVTTDLSAESRRAYEPACELARLTGAQISLLHAIPVIVDMGVDVVGGMAAVVPRSVGDLKEEKEQALRALESERERLDVGLEVHLETARGPKVVREILEFVEAHAVDAIVLSTHGRSGARRLLLGSVAEEVMRGANVPVLCIPPTESEEPA